MRYIAYGSNMNIDQMARRCPNAKLVGTGRLLGTYLSFYVHATVERAKAEDAYVPVAVWEIIQADEARLDRYEGFPNYYIKEEWPVQLDDGTATTGMIYLMNLRRGNVPTEEYYHGIWDAYEELGLADEIEMVLEPALRRAIRRAKKTGTL